ncbi:MAG: molecular chaperone HtpG [Clostridia bacterium]|nr:molecular chaperone HtpG [Clostridia bacterium]
MSENTVKGGISVETAHIFPVIKKWLYSEKEIFVRELVSNACDAATKMKRLSSLGQVKGLEDEKYRIDVIVSKNDKTITVKDNGIGMSESEVEKYICQMALSGALDFIQKYEGESENNQSGIIGHFGLGFYSAFMVSDRVELITKSYTDAPAVKWSCNDAGEYEMSTTDEREERGTEIILHINSEGEEYLSAYKLSEVLEKYCSFMPVEIYFTDADAEKKEGEEEKTPEPVNDVSPLWLKNPSDCTKEEYIEFYRKVFHDYREPLFYIHLNVDYPLNFKGILYFPKLAHEYDSLEGQVKLYYNQVYVADNIKEVIPEFLLMLKGVLDCPELPLNVSRSYLQNSGYVSKISSHIVKKVADKINSMFNTQREEFEKLWRDLKTFVEYGALRDRKFFERVLPAVIWEKTDGSFVTLDDYLEAAKEKHENTVYYTTDKVSQAQYVSMFENENIDVVVLDTVIETQFITLLENEKKIKFVRVDADLAGVLKADGEAGDEPALTKLMQKVSGNAELEVKYELLKDGSTPAVLNISEEERRMEDMMRMYRMSMPDFGAQMPSSKVTLVINKSSNLIKHILEILPTDEARAEKIAKQTYTLALLSQRQLTAEELKGFLAQSYSVLEEL